MYTSNPNNTICYNCFQEKPSGTETCPHCGFNLEENEKKFPVALRAGTVLNNRYIIGRVLGQGGFGITYLAWDQKLQAKVAVKEFMPGEIATRVGTTVSIMMESRTEDFTYGAERFQEEARTLAKFMGQPGIAGVTDYFDENDTSYFVMDYIEGISFKTYIANQGGRVSADEALNVMIPVLRALTAVHAEGFIHRDVTPDNIYITRDGNVKLLDFGSARYSLGDKSKSLDVILKVGYAPKEQYIRRGRQGPYTDVYSCAACLYAAITGYLPPESLERLDQDTLVPPSQAGVEIPLYLERAILKGLAVQPEDRFQSAAEFLEAIESQQVVELSSAKGQEALPAEKKKISKPVIFGAGAAVVALGVGLFLMMGRGMKQPETADGTEGVKTVAEALAPKVTIAGEEYSTALTELNLTGKNLTDADLISLGEMKNLKSLNLMENASISDLSPLAGLTSLETLRLPCPSGIKDLSPLAGLTNLTYLTMTGGGNNTLPPSDVRDYSPLSGLTNLQRLSLIITNLQDLSFLSELTELTSLKLMGSVSAPDLTPLSGLVNLKELDLHTEGMTTVDGIESLVHLQTLRILDNTNTLYQEDLSCLSGMTELQSLRFDVSGLASFHGIENLTQLKEAEFYGKYATYTDLDPFKNLTNLQVLHISVHETGTVFNGDGLAGLTNLTDLDLASSIESLEPLRNLTNLRNLSIENGGLTEGAFHSLEPLKNLTELQSLGVRFADTADIDLTPLSGLTKLTYLFVGARRMRSGTPALDLSPLSGLTQLRTLKLDLGNVRDLSPLASLSNLQNFTIGESPVSDWSPVAHVPSVNKAN